MPPSSPDSNTYSSLDGVKSNAVAPQDDKHYSPLLHKTGTDQVKSVPLNNGQDIGSEYGKVPHPSSEGRTRPSGNNKNNNNNSNQQTIQEEHNS